MGYERLELSVSSVMSRVFYLKLIAPNTYENFTPKRNRTFMIALASHYGFHHHLCLCAGLCLNHSFRFRFSPLSLYTFISRCLARRWVAFLKRAVHRI